MKFIFRVMYQIRPYWGPLFGIFVLSMLTAPVALLQPLPIKIVVDHVVGSEPLPAYISDILPMSIQNSDFFLIIAVILLVGIAVLNHLMTLGIQLMQTRTGENMLLDFRVRLFSHAQSLSLKYHDSRGASESTFRIQYDAPSILAIIIHGFIPIVTSVLTLCGMFYVTSQIDRMLAIVALGISPVLFILALAYGGPLKGRWATVKELESSAQAIIQETLTSMRVVKVFGREKYEEEKFLARSRQYKDELLKVFFMQGGIDVLIGVSIATGMAATLFVGVQHVQEGILSLGSLLLVLGYVTQIYGPLRTISSQFIVLQGAIVSVQRAFSILDQEPEALEHESAQQIGRAIGHIEFENVSFGYESGQRILNSVNFKVPAGSTIGIQGLTGAGKSSLISLLTRFYNADEGRILLDGMDIRRYKLEAYRNQFGVVLQDPVLFSASVAENISYGRPDANFDDIINAAKLASAHDFIVSLKEGYETPVGERGMRLSGGERQRISLARAYLKDAPILVLDEPTSSIDSETEKAIISSLYKLMQGRTTFIISHRLGTLERCDIRLQIVGGQVLEL